MSYTGCHAEPRTWGTVTYQRCRCHWRKCATAHDKPTTEHDLTLMPHKARSRLPCVTSLHPSGCDTDMCGGHTCALDKCWARSCAKLAVAEPAQRRARTATETCKQPKRRTGCQARRPYLWLWHLPAQQMSLAQMHHTHMASQQWSTISHARLIRPAEH